MYKLSLKIERATRMQIRIKGSSTEYQTTNYGLGGLCETHLDPSGYVMHGVLASPESHHVRLYGDMIATTMAWLNDVKLGGGTAYMYSNW